MVVRLNVEISNSLDGSIKEKIAKINAKRKEDEPVLKLKQYVTDLIEKDLGIKK